ncbi:MAG: TonB-dependent receptor, partial [Myxococcaceae bacterium]
AKEFPTPVRDYDAVTVYLNRTFTEGWLAQASYTWSRLYGNYPGLFRPENNQLDPNILADFDLVALLNNRKGLLPFDRTHAIKVFGAKEFNISNAMSASIGLSYRGNSGTPISYLGAYPGYGQDETFILPRGTGGRTPWINSVDSNVGVNYRVSKDSVVSFTLDVFNLFNFQGADSVDESFTFSQVLPVYDPQTGKAGNASDLPGPGNEGNVELADHSGKLEAEDVNQNFKNPDRYQAPRQIRFGVRYTF